MPSVKWTDEALLDAIRSQAVDGVPPTAKGWQGPPSKATIRARFGTWNEAVRVAGFTPRTGKATGVRQADYISTKAVAAVVRKEGLPLRVVAQLAGMSERQLKCVMNGERQFMTYRVADRLLCAIGRPDAWHLELAEETA